MSRPRAQTVGGTLEPVEHDVLADEQDIIIAVSAAFAETLRDDEVERSGVEARTEGSRDTAECLGDERDGLGAAARAGGIGADLEMIEAIGVALVASGNLGDAQAILIVAVDSHVCFDELDRLAADRKPQFTRLLIEATL